MTVILPMMVIGVGMMGLEVFEFFMIRGLFAGIGVAFVTGIMGCFVVWRRMAYFGDSLSHSGLLGIALGLATGLGLHFGVVITCFIFAVSLLWLQRRRILTHDTLLGILAHSSLSIGIISMSFLDRKFNLHSYLFGDILTVTLGDLFWIYIGGGIIFTFLLLYWSSFVLLALHEDLAVSEGINAFIMNLLFLFLMTIVVAVSVNIVGILLITSLLIIPSATARYFSRSPEMMAFYSVLLGIFSVIFGIYGSFIFDTPSGPSIVVSCTIFFIFSSLLSHFFTLDRF